MLTDADIAKEVGIGPRTLYRGKRNPVLIVEVEGHVADFDESIRRPGIPEVNDGSKPSMIAGRECSG